MVFSHNSYIFLHTENYEGCFYFKQRHTLMLITVLYKSYAVVTLEYSGSVLPRKLRSHHCFRVHLHSASFSGVREIFYHRTTIKLLTLLILIRRSYLSLTTVHQYNLSPLILSRDIEPLYLSLAAAYPTILYHASLRSVLS